MLTAAPAQLGAAALAGACCALGASWMLRRRTYRGTPYELASSPLEGIISYHHMYVDATGKTRIARDQPFGKLIKKGYSGTPQYVRDFSSAFKVKSMIVTQQFGPNPWHYCPSPQFVITLRGQWYIETGDGEIIVMTPGDCLYQDNVKEHPFAVEGTRAAQHYSGVVPGTGPCNQLVIQVDTVPTPDNAGVWS